MLDDDDENSNLLGPHHSRSDNGDKNLYGKTLSDNDNYNNNNDDEEEGNGIMRNYKVWDYVAVPNMERPHATF